jgi:hypothetical protein
MEHSQVAHTAYWKWLPAAFALAGIILFIFATYGPPASSSGFVSTLNGFWSNVAPDYAQSKPHYRMIPGPGSWLFAFVLGMAIGGFIGGRSFQRVSGIGDKQLTTTVRDVPVLWQKRFGGSPARRYTATFMGGFLILFASRLAGGCTLGLFISGSTQLALSGLYFGVLIFGVAMLTARLVYGQTAKEEK